MKYRLAAAMLLCAGVALTADAFGQRQTVDGSAQPAAGAAGQGQAPAATPAPPSTTNTTTAISVLPLTPVGQPVSVDRPATNARAPRTGTIDPRAVEMATAYEIGPEDLLDISVWKNVELSRVVPVRPDGKVSLPLVNDIQAAGLTPGQLRDQITTKLAEYIPAPEVSVMVREVHSRKVAVVGAVKMPGRYEMKSPMTVLEAIALAQGLTDFASRDRIVVLRDVDGKTTQIPFNYRKIADGAAQQNFFLRSGDIVVVP